MPTWLALFTIAGIFDLTPPERPGLPLDEEIGGPPVLDWSRRLPGPKVTAATHTELVRPAVDGESIFVGSAGDSSLLRLLRSTGELLVEYPARAPLLAEAVAADGRVWFVDGAGYTFCYAIEGGEPIWSHFGGAPITARPTLTAETAYVANVDGVVFALHASTGEVRWRYQRPTDASRQSDLTLFGAPSPVVVEDELLVGFSDGAVLALDLSTGRPIWEARVGEGRYPDIIGTPRAEGDDLYVGGYSEPFVALDLRNRTPRWRIDAGTAAEPLVEEQLLFHPSTDGKLRAVRRDTGEVLWTFETGDSGALSSPQATAIGVLVSSSDEGIYLVDRETGALLWRYDPGYQLNGVTAGLTVVGRQILALTNAGTLLSFVAPAPPPTVLEIEGDRSWDGRSLFRPR